MTIILIILTAAAAIPDQFTPVEGFMDLENSATPTRFGLLLVTGEDSVSNLQMAELILATMDSLPDDAFTDLYVITMDEPGYPDIAALCGYYSGSRRTGICNFCRRCNP